LHLSYHCIPDTFIFMQIRSGKHTFEAAIGVIMSLKH